jgi:hypothetical protein
MAIDSMYVDRGGKASRERGPRARYLQRLSCCHNAKLEQCARRMHCDLISAMLVLLVIPTPLSIAAEGVRAGDRDARCLNGSSSSCNKVLVFGERGVCVPVSAGLIL